MRMRIAMAEMTDMRATHVISKVVTYPGDPSRCS